MIPGVILAGGQSRRMGGGDKCLLPLGTGTLLDLVTQRLSMQAAPLALNANGDPSRFTATGLPVLADTVDGFVGPLAGVLTAMEWAGANGAPSVVTVAADTPFFPDDLVARLLDTQAGRTERIVLAGTISDGRAHRHPTFGLWPVSLAGDLKASLDHGVRKVVQWTDTNDCQTAMFEGEDPFFNVNTPEDLDRARARHGAKA